MARKNAKPNPFFKQLFVFRVLFDLVLTGVTCVLQNHSSIAVTV